MNNLAETEQERENRKNKNLIVGLIVLNIIPVYAGKIHKISIRSSLRLSRIQKSSIYRNDRIAKYEFSKKSFLVLRLAHTIIYLHYVSFQYQ